MEDVGLCVVLRDEQPEGDAGFFELNADVAIGALGVEREVAAEIDHGDVHVLWVMGEDGEGLVALELRAEGEGGAGGLESGSEKEQSLMRCGGGGGGRSGAGRGVERELVIAQGEKVWEVLLREGACEMACVCRLQKRAGMGGLQELRIDIARVFGIEPHAGGVVLQRTHEGGMV